MRYDTIRDQIKTGDAFVSSGKWLMSRAIRLFTGDDVSHIGIFVWVQLNGTPRRLCMLESMEGSGVRLVPARFTLETGYWNQGAQIYWQPLKRPEHTGLEIADFIVNHWGEGYASKYQFVVGLSKIIRYVRPILGKTIDTDETRWHCAELIIRALMNRGYQHDKDPAITTPGDVSKIDWFGERVPIERPLRAW